MADPMSIYRITIEPDEDGWWTVSADDVPGAHSHGQTLERARTNIKEAIAMMENLPEGAERDMEVQAKILLPPATDEAVGAVWTARAAYEIAAGELSSTTQNALEVIAKEFPDLGLRDIAVLLGLSYQRVAQLRPGAPRRGRRAAPATS